MGFSQEQKIEGIGQFKISKTPISYLNDLASQMGVEIKQISDNGKLYDIEKRSTSFIIQLIKDPSKTGFSEIIYSTDCPQYSVFLVSGLTISTFTFNNVYLTFYRDTLIRFKSDYVEKLDEALTIKYGKPELFDDEKDITCVYTYTGATIKKKEMNLKQTWKNEFIEAVISNWQFYTSDCKEHIVSDFSVENTEYMHLLYQCEKDQKDADKQKEKDELKKKSDGL